MPKFPLYQDPTQILVRALTRHTLSMVYHRVVAKELTAIEDYMFSLVKGVSIPHKVDVEATVLRCAAWVLENQDDEYYSIYKASIRANWTIFDLERADVAGKSKAEQARILGCSEATISNLRRRARAAQTDPQVRERQAKIKAGIQRRIQRKANFKKMRRALRAKALFYAQRAKTFLVGSTPTRMGGRRLSSKFLEPMFTPRPRPPLSPEILGLLD